MPEDNQEDEVTDYGSYFKKRVSTFEKPIVQQSPLQSIPISKNFTSRVVILIIVLLILIGAQVALILISEQSKMPPLPKGYKLVSPPGQPAHIEPIK